MQYPSVRPAPCAAVPLPPGQGGAAQQSYRAAQLTGIQACQRHPSGHTFRVQLQRSRQSVLAHRSLHLRQAGTGQGRVDKHWALLVRTPAGALTTATRLAWRQQPGPRQGRPVLPHTSAATVPSAAHRSAEAPSSCSPARATRSAAAVSPARLGAGEPPAPELPIAGWARISCSTTETAWGCTKSKHRLGTC